MPGPGGPSRPAAGGSPGSESDYRDSLATVTVTARVGLRLGVRVGLGLRRTASAAAGLPALTQSPTVNPHWQSWTQRPDSEPPGPGHGGISDRDSE